MLNQNAAAGTYDFQNRPDKQIELKRLQAQAGLASAAERAMWKQAGLRDGMRVLDLGCGPGVVSCTLAAELPTGRVVGADLSEELLAKAQETKDLLGLANVTFERANVYELPFADGSFDFVYARLVFQHLRDPELALAEIKRVLKPGGRVCLMDVDDRFLMLSPEPAHFTKFKDAAARAQREEGGNREIGGALFGMLSASGLANVQTLVHVIRSEECGMKNFLDIALRFRATRLATNPEYLEGASLLAALQEFRDLETTAGAWGAVGMFVGVGVKPVS